MTSMTLETPSGKDKQDENFPVGSFLIRTDLRPHVHAFYAFARNADDIADNPALTPEIKLERLNRMAAILQGSGEDGSPTADALRKSLRECGVTAQHSLDLLRAFKQDAVIAALTKPGTSFTIIAATRRCRSAGTYWICTAKAAPPGILRMR